MNTSTPVAKIASLYTICILAVTALVAVLLEATGSSWSDAIVAFVKGSLLNAGSWGETLTFMVPLILVSLGAILSFSSGFVNIGQEGQLIIGGAFAAYVGTKLSLPVPLNLFFILGAGFLAGAVWAGIAASLKFWRNIPEVLTTLLLIMLAFQLSGYGLKTASLLADPNPPTASRSVSSAPLEADSRLGEITIFGNSISIGIFIALGLAVVLWVVMNKMTLGLKLQILSQNPVVARRSGISTPVYGFSILCISGGMAGLAGAAILTSGLTGYVFLPGFSFNLGWTGLLVALVAGNRAWLAVLVSMLFAGLHTGSQFLAATGIDRQIGNVTSALFVLALLIPPALIYFQQNLSSRSRILGNGDTA